MEKVYNYNLIESLRSGIIEPETWYTVEQAAFYLGVHKQTIYDYTRRRERPLASSRSENGFHMLIQGKVLIDYKAAGPFKKGRRRKSGC